MSATRTATCSTSTSACAATPTRLTVLGNGKQRKSYLYVQDCIDAIFLAVERAETKTTILNLGTDEYCDVNDSIGWITGALGIAPQLNYTGGERGWIGDSPFIFLDCARMRRLGWAPKLSIQQGSCARSTICARIRGSWRRGISRAPTRRHSRSSCNTQSL